MAVRSEEIDGERARAENPEELMQALGTSPDGLSQAEADARLEKVGPNALPERRKSLLREVAGYFWGPIPWMIEAAAALSAVVGHWADLVIILFMLVFNAAVGFFQEHQASNAVAALKSRLAVSTRVRRDGRWQPLPAPELVPGDVVRVRLGDIVPADLKLIDGDYLMIDQSALTGESLPLQAGVGDVAYSGSVVRQGEMVALVTATGASTYFGRTAKLVEEAAPESHFQRAVLTIGDYLIYLSLALVSVIVTVQLLRGAPLLELAQFALIVVVASIPVALPAVLSVTMALGALSLSRLKAIVARLEAIEEMAGIDVLCADKTGTLTKNELRVGDPKVVEASDAQELVGAAALASREENGDPIDLAVLAAVDGDHEWSEYRQARFTPFDPVAKRASAEIEGPDGSRFEVTKGAPQVILDLADLPPERRSEVEASVDELAAAGNRTLGVARREGDGPWMLLGLLPLSDPPRDDARETIEQAAEHGIQVKMVTGDNRSIAREIAGQLGLGTRIQSAGEALGEGEDVTAEAAQRVEAAEGFAEVFPEHKYRIVQALQSRGHLTGMTGDGVNDAPALKQADVGIAVSGATDAARAAADLVLTAPGLSVVVTAVEEARRIFERMHSYTVYRITETLRIVVFIALAMLVYDFYPITAVMVILLALLNDVPIMSIAFDNTWLDPKPARWEMDRILTLASVLGLVGVAETFLLLVIAESWLHLPPPQLQSMIFLKLAIAGHLTLFVARSRRAFYRRPWPALPLLASVVGTQILAVAVVGFGWFVEPLPWRYIGFVWAYALVWVFIEDWAKLRVYAHRGRGTPRHRAFLSRLQERLHPHGSGRGGHG
ncbi:MAG TPA: plasma-membrane proton-efflux P-type ATPase [Gammaproteobacteria bacterium]|nr:plasma-membrane proton-efflux P-type ATPase [Gammaproteobacteria bacterium]